MVSCEKTPYNSILETINMKICEGGFGELKRLYVRPTFSGRGLATTLMGVIDAYARKQGAGVLRLQTANYTEPRRHICKFREVDNLFRRPRRRYPAYTPRAHSILPRSGRSHAIPART